MVFHYLGHKAYKQTGTVRTAAGTMAIFVEKYEKEAVRFGTNKTEKDCKTRREVLQCYMKKYHALLYPGSAYRIILMRNGFRLQKLAGGRCFVDPAD